MSLRQWRIAQRAFSQRNRLAVAALENSRLQGRAVALRFTDAVAESADQPGDSCIRDTRRCLLCRQIGDRDEYREGRLLPLVLPRRAVEALLAADLYDSSKAPAPAALWLHLQCSAWSALDQLQPKLKPSDPDSGLQIGMFVSRLLQGLARRCRVCGQRGATLLCGAAPDGSGQRASACGNAVHFGCGQRSGLLFCRDGRVFCAPPAACIVDAGVVLPLAESDADAAEQHQARVELVEDMALATEQDVEDAANASPEQAISHGDPAVARVDTAAEQVQPQPAAQAPLDQPAAEAVAEAAVEGDHRRERH